MKNWAYYNSLNGNASAEIKSWIDNRANEGFDEFKVGKVIVKKCC